MAMILDEVLLLPQPACVLQGEPTRGPGPEMPPAMMQLSGMTLPPNPMAVMLTPPGPGPCESDPQGWTVVEPETGRLQLCPLACHDVATWQARGLAASIDFECG